MPESPAKYRMHRWVILLIAAVAVNYGVAVYCQWRSCRASHAAYVAGESEVTTVEKFEPSDWPVDSPSDWPTRPNRGTIDYTPWCDSVYICFVHRTDDPLNRSMDWTEGSMTEDRYGWPWRSVFDRFLWRGGNDSGTRRCCIWLPEKLDVSGKPTIPIGIRPLPFVANTAVYGTLLWSVGFVFGWARRRSRIRRGLCVQCKYPVGTAPVCSECGARVVVAKG